LQPRKEIYVGAIDGQKNVAGDLKAVDIFLLSFASFYMQRTTHAEEAGGICDCFQEAPIVG
jgi:hypothetical protein